MKLALVSDAWTPQVNGVVRTLTTTAAELVRRGHDVETITPGQFRTLPCPTYPEIRLAIGCGAEVAARLDRARADAVHIATEGPLGWAARRWCLRNGMAFTTSFHTHFARYLAVRTHLPDWLFWPAITRFHAPAMRTFAATPTLERELRTHAIARTHRWARGVDPLVFSPTTPADDRIAALPRPILLSVGRVAVEKNLRAFLDAPVAGTKVVVGDGPALEPLSQRYPEAVFTGALQGARLASAYAAADVFVFPSLTDTFGLVMIEALASGLPVAAFPVPGPIDILGADGRGMNGAQIGALDHRLEQAIARALACSGADCVAEAQRYSWQQCTDQFIAGLAIRPAGRATGGGATNTAMPVGQLRG